MIRTLLALVALASLVGCGSMPLPPQPTPDEPPPVSSAPARRGQSGGVFVPDAGWSLTSDNRAFRAGDVLTIVLPEPPQASKRAGTSLGQSSSAGIPPLARRGQASVPTVRRGAP